VNKPAAPRARRAIKDFMDIEVGLNNKTPQPAKRFEKIVNNL